MTSRRRPALPVDLPIIEQTLLAKGGSIAAAARVLGVPSVDLRRLVASRPLLADAIYEGTERAIDAAEQRYATALRAKIRWCGLRLRRIFCTPARAVGAVGAARDGGEE